MTAGLMLAIVVLVGCGGMDPGKAAAKPDSPGSGAKGQPATPTPPTGPQQGGANTIPKQWAAAPEMQIDTNKQYFATLKTNKGDIRVELFAKESPKTVNNFVFLARQGFYDKVPFHRIIQNFMVQTGDPTGTGRGGPGYRFNDELPAKHSYEPGIVAMANGGANTNGSQFFICSGEQCKNLDNPKLANYTQFGRVVGGTDVLSKLAATPVGLNQLGEASQPKEDVHIETVTIEEK